MHVSIYIIGMYMTFAKGRARFSYLSRNIHSIYVSYDINITTSILMVGRVYNEAELNTNERHY